MKIQTILLACFTAGALLLTGCSTNAQTGALVGSLVGAGIGKSTSNHRDKRAIIGGLVGGIVGSAVNITSRIQAKADAQEIVISDAVYKYLKYLKNEINIQRSFNASMKGVDHPMTLHVLKKDN